VVEAGDLKILVQYNLQRDHIHFLDEYGRPAPQPVAAARVEPPSGAAASPNVINLPPILFDFGKAAIGSQAKATLEGEVRPKLMERNRILCVINGHADELGSAQYNQALSEKRADAVRAYLESIGVDGSKIKVVAFGQRLPEKTCEAVKGRAARIACLAPNRRVTIELQLPPL
jgi:OOP family OmpA-OmpF porin